MGSTKFIWDPHDLVGPMLILTNQRECVKKCVLKCVLLAFLVINVASAFCVSNRKKVNSNFNPNIYI